MDNMRAAYMQIGARLQHSSCITRIRLFDLNYINTKTVATNETLSVGGSNDYNLHLSDESSDKKIRKLIFICKSSCALKV